MNTALRVSASEACTMNIHNVEFIKSTAGTGAFIRDGRPNIVFSGKSNVGKSSVINCLLNRRNFARVGAHPGKTIHVNYFHIDKKVYFVDLPGYGYASVAKTERERWGKTMEAFFSDPERIDLGVMIVDSRHKPTKDDVTMADWFHSTGCPLVVVANKTDKLKKSEIEPNLKVIAETLSLDDSAVLIPFSAEKGTGRELLLAELMKVVK